MKRWLDTTKQPLGVIKSICSSTSKELGVYLFCWQYMLLYPLWNRLFSLQYPTHLPYLPNTPRYMDYNYLILWNMDNLAETQLERGKQSSNDCMSYWQNDGTTNNFLCPKYIFQHVVNPFLVITGSSSFQPLNLVHGFTNKLIQNCPIKYLSLRLIVLGNPWTHACWMNISAAYIAVASFVVGTKCVNLVNWLTVTNTVLSLCWVWGKPKTKSMETFCHFLSIMAKVCKIPR